MDLNTPPAAAERSAILEAVYQAWEQGDTLEAWVTRYPADAEDLAALALSCGRDGSVPPAVCRGPGRAGPHCRAGCGAGSACCGRGDLAPAADTLGVGGSNQARWRDAAILVGPVIRMLVYRKGVVPVFGD